MIEKIRNKSFFFHEFNIQKCLSRFFDGLIKSILESVRNVNNVNNFCLESRIEHIGSVKIVFEISTSGKYQTINVTSVISNESLGCDLTYFSEVIVPFLFSKTSESYWWLTSFIVFLGKLNRKLVKNLFSVSL